MTVSLYDIYHQSWASTCLLSLGAYGQPANNFMKILLEDIENGPANAVEAIDGFRGDV